MISEDQEKIFEQNQNLRYNVDGLANLIRRAKRRGRITVGVLGDNGRDLSVSHDAKVGSPLFDVLMAAVETEKEEYETRLAALTLRGT